MGVSKKHETACWVADIVVAPVVGAMFLAVAAIIAIVGKVTVNGRQLSRAGNPREFALALGGAILLGLLCIGYAALRWWILRRSSGRDGIPIDEHSE